MEGVGEWENGRVERWKGGRMEPEDRRQKTEDRRQNNPSNSELRTPNSPGER
jgi:hypothetical protein